MSNYSWIKDSGVIIESKLIEFCSNFLDKEKYQFIALYTDKFVSNDYEIDSNCPIIDIEHLLELRIFNKTEEIYIKRDTVDVSFSYRIANDERIDKLDEIIYDEIQYVNPAVNLPITTENAVQIRNYLNYSPVNGRVYVADFRIVKFTNKEVEKLCV